MKQEGASFWMKDIETASKEKIKEIQLYKLKKQLEYVERRSKFYREKFSRDRVSVSEVRTLDDLHSLPLTTRDEIVADQKKYGRLGNLMATDYTDPGQTIGLTGVKISASDQPIKVIMSLSDAAFQGKLAARGLTAVGITRSDYLYVADYPAFSLLYIDLGLGSINVGSKSLFVGMERAERNTSVFPSLYPPTAYYINPSYAKFIIPLLKKAGKENPIRIVLGWSEPGYSIACWRERFQEKWAEVSSSPEVKVYDVYGMTELGFLAFECSHQNGLHGFEDAYIYEVIDPETEELLPPGGEGELVVTHLEARGMPLVRYRTGDITGIDDGPCPCGRSHLRLKGIKGRYSQRLNISGKTIYLSQIEDIVGRFKDYSGDFNVLIDGAQILDRLELALAKEEVNSDLVTKMQKELEKRLGISVLIAPVKREDLLVFPHRSFKIIDRKKLEFLKKEIRDQHKVED
jgi:phenylacetate-CoA ligase